MMDIRKYSQLMFLVLCSASICYGEDYFPDIDGYQTLVCDFHTHTIFSDGRVWPTVRIEEAIRESIDAVAITDHIEYRPHKDDIPADHNRSYSLVEEMAKQNNVLAIKGTEITRDTPPGHYNAIFIDDVIPLDVKEFLTVIQTANEQGGFVFWNHHAWKGSERGDWKEVQDVMYKNQWLKGMEVANGGSYYPDAHRWCLEKGMTMLGNSDIHGPSIDYIYSADKHRTLTLVFSKARTVESIHESLNQGHTAVWYNNQVIGREEFLNPLFSSCVKISEPHYVDENGRAFFVMENHALVDFQLTAVGETKPSRISIPARSKVVVRTTLEDAGQAELAYQVDNFLVAPETSLQVQFTIMGQFELAEQ